MVPSDMQGQRPSRIGDRQTADTPGAAGRPAPSVAPPFPRSGRAWSVVALLLIAYTIALLDRQILSLMVQPIRADLKISDTQLSLLAGFAFVLFYSTMGLVLGNFADRHNRRNLIVSGMVIWCLATIGCGLSRSYGELFAARMLVGFGEAALGPAAYSMIADYFPPEKRSRATGVYTMGVFMGTGVAMMFGGAAIAVTARAGLVEMPFVGAVRPWQATFLLVGLPGLVVAAAMLAVREPIRQDVGGGSGSVTALLAFVRANRAQFALILGGFGMNGLINYGVTTWVPTVFVRLHGWSAEQIGGVYGLILLVFGSSGVLAGGWWVSRGGLASDRNRVRRTAAISLAAMIPLIPICGLAPAPWQALAALAALAFVIGVPSGLAPIALFERTPNRFRGQVIAFYLLSVTLLGLGCGVTLIAASNDYLFADDRAVGKSLTLVLVAAALVGIACLWGSMRRSDASGD